MSKINETTRLAVCSTDDGNAMKNTGKMQQLVGIVILLMIGGGCMTDRDEDGSAETERQRERERGSVCDVTADSC